MRHPRDMGAAEVEAFLTMLATERQVSASTHNQALRALLFLFREVLGMDLPWLNGVNRPTQKRRIPSVLTREEVASLFQFLDGKMALLPKSLAPALHQQLLRARAVWDADRQAQRGGVETPHALEQKYPKVGQTWGWFWLFPSPTLSVDPRSGVERRHHLLQAGTDIRTVRELLGMIYTHVLKVAAGGTASPLDALSVA